MSIVLPPALLSVVETAQMLEVTWLHWVLFLTGLLLLLVLDLCVFHREAHEPTLTESGLWTLFWVALALLFNGFIWWWGGTEAGLNFFTGYLVEKMLSMDNVFVFLVIFSYFHVPLKYQYRVLFWGILGAMVMRLVFILIAYELLTHFDWILYVFGAFLLYTGVKLVTAHGVETDPQKNVALRLAKRVVPITHEMHGQKFFTRIDGKLFATPLFLVLLVVETTDVIFAVDSIPAIFGITQDPFIVFTSNMFAILGLRALYFLLAGMVEYFQYLHYGLGAVLVFIGAKMLLHHWIELPIWASLIAIVLLLGSSMALSLLLHPKTPPIDEDITPDG